jgi:hypothetical protein
MTRDEQLRALRYLFAGLVVGGFGGFIAGLTIGILGMH